MSPNRPPFFYLRPGIPDTLGVQFDVAITTKTIGDGLGKTQVSILVVEAEIGGGGSIAHENASRIKSTVFSA